MTRFAIALVLGLLAVSAFAELAPHYSYEEQFRDSIDAPPSAKFWLGTDALGRDRWSRLVYGTRVSLLLAIAASAVSVTLAALFGVAAGTLGGAAGTALVSIADVFQCVPWFFLLTAVRGALPLNTSPLVSVILTFALLGLLGWATPARVLSLRAREVSGSDYIRQAVAAGVPRTRLLLRHIAPNLLPLLWAQFWILVPAYIVAEANLGVLGLGVAEPLPSWGALLRELESAQNWGTPGVLIPILLLAAVAGSLQMAFRSGRGATT